MPAKRQPVSASSVSNRAILAKISHAHAFIYLQNPIMSVALWAVMLFVHITVAANEIKHHS